MTQAETARLAWVRGLCRTGEARRIRLQAGFSLRDIAAPLPVGPSTVLRWELGRAVPSYSNALAYAAVLKTLQRTAVPA